MTQFTPGPLAPCPFACQTRLGPYVHLDAEEWDIARVECGDCGAAGPYVDLADYGDDEIAAQTEAVRRWNAHLAVAKARGEQ